MQISNYIIALILSIGAFGIALSSPMYEKTKKIQWIIGIVIGVLVYLGGLILAFMNNKLGGVVLAIGSILIALCSYFYNKSVCDTAASTTKKSVLVGGIILGVAMLVTGVIISHPPLLDAVQEAATTGAQTAKNIGSKVLAAQAGGMATAGGLAALPFSK